jgi:tetratricopeptide (TPR) repeat protein
VHFNLALSWTALNAHEDALSEYENAVLKTPKKDTIKLQQVYLKVAETCSILGKWSCAADYFKKHMLLKSDNHRNDRVDDVDRNYIASLINLNDVPATLRALEHGTAKLQRGAGKNAKDTRYLVCEGAYAGLLLQYLLRRDGTSIDDDDNNEDAEARANVLMDQIQSFFPTVKKYVDACFDASVEDDASLIDFGLRISTLSDTVTRQFLEPLVSFGNDDDHLFLRNHALANAVVYRLGMSYQRQKEFQREKQLYETALSLHLLSDVNQRPGYRYVKDKASGDMTARNLAALPIHYPSEVDFSSKGTRWHRLRDLITFLEDNVVSLSTECRSTGLRSSTDMERIVSSGHWKQVPIVRDGKYLKEQRTHLLPTLQALVQRVRSDEAEDLPLGAVEISVLSNSTTLKAHCGPSNHKLRIHVAISVPKYVEVDTQPIDYLDCGVEVDGDCERVPNHLEVFPSPQSFSISDDSIDSTLKLHWMKQSPWIRIGQHVYFWKEGEVLLFDDSFEHEVSNPHRDAERAVLIVDVWHPDLNEEDRRKVRAHFGYEAAH